MRGRRKGAGEQQLHIKIVPNFHKFAQEPYHFFSFSLKTHRYSKKTKGGLNLFSCIHSRRKHYSDIWCLQKKKLSNKNPETSLGKNRSTASDDNDGNDDVMCALFFGSAIKKCYQMILFLGWESFRIHSEKRGLEGKYWDVKLNCFSLFLFVAYWLDQVFLFAECGAGVRRMANSKPFQINQLFSTER